MLFNFAVEFLGLAIRQNPKIIGIKIVPMEKKHAQYADDLWASIMATQESFDELMNTFKNFVKISGLKINYDKTQVLRISSLSSNTQFQLKSEKPMNWTHSIKVLGITVEAQREEMLTKNYQTLIEKMKKVLNPWLARTLSLLGKVTIVNSLIMSQAVYKLLSINLPSEKILAKIKELVVRFIWNRKKAKIAYKTMIRKKGKGNWNCKIYKRKILH